MTLAHPFHVLQGPLLDFFGVPVKANDVLGRVEELQHLAKRISRYKDPILQFRVLRYLKPANWSKGCGWNQSKHYFPIVKFSLFSLIYVRLNSVTCFAF